MEVEGVVGRMGLGLWRSNRFTVQFLCGYFGW